MAYRGYLQHPGDTYIWEVLEDNTIRNLAKESMWQSASILRLMYPEVFTEKQLTEHVDDLLLRFANRKLGDTVFRVGCDLYRKLSFDDRIVTPLVCGYQYGLPVDRISDTLVAAFQFKATGPDGKMFPGDIDFHTELGKYGTKHMLEKICKIKGSMLSKTYREMDKKLPRRHNTL